jgi:hypothetical protein
MLKTRKKLVGIVLALTMLLVSAGAGASAPAAANPSAISGFLPIGPYANGAGWGSIYSDGTLTTGTTYKFVSGIAAPYGVSLGLFGGYIQFDMGAATPIANDPNNPYGVDFIVYGNNSTGNNPEAGSVAVSSNGTDWYELAGSRYYNPAGDTYGVQHIPQISYIKVSATDAKFDATGIWYSWNYAGNVSAATWHFVNSSLRWWPDSSKGYDLVYDIDGYVNTTGGAPYVVVDRDAGPYEIITYKNITGLNPYGFNDPANFQFGYFDVTPNGSNYGTAVNPYVPYSSSKIGGDGYDLSWAVDPSGEPVALDSVRFVRLYSSIMSIDSTSGGISSEVLGLYRAQAATGDGAATSDLEIWNAAETVETETTNMGSVTVAAGSYVIYSDEDYVFVNGSSVDASTGYSLSLSSGDIVQIITQSGTESPYVTVIKCT